MTTIDATPAALAELVAAWKTTKRELQKMLRINHAFRKGRREFSRYGFADADFFKFSDIIKRHPEYGIVPFPPDLIRAKMARMNRLKKQILAGKRLLTPAHAS